MKHTLTNDAYRLSPMQEGMLFHYLKEPNSGVDIEQIVIHLRESIFPDRLRAAWELLVSRHEILRTRFVWDRSGQPNQEVLSDVSLPFQLEKITGLDDDERRKTLQAFLDSDRVHGFDMNCAPMLRITLFQWRETEFSLVWTFHHALLDGRSYPALLREVFENYEELASDRVPARIAPQSYRRHIEWITNRDFAEADGFWKQLLSGVTSLTPIVVENLELCAESVSRQGEAWNALDAATTRKLRRIAESNDLSLNSIVMGLWAILLRRYSGESTVVFGATRACRKSSVEGSDETVGLFINTVPVRAEISDEESALSTIGKVRKQWVEMRPYEHTPLARIKSVSQMPPGLPLFETLVVFENHRLDAVMNSLGGAWAHRTVELHELTNFPITLAAYDGDSLSFKIEFDRRRLGEDTVKRMLGHLKCLLDGVAQDPMTCVRDLRIQTDAERRELIVDFNTPAQRPRSDQLPLDGSATLHELFEAQVARRPQAVALTCEGQSLTYAEANARANQLADLLVERGVTRGKLVGLCLERNNDLVIAILAILKAGGAYLPIDLAYPAERLAFMLEDAQAPILITQKSLLSNLPSVPVEIICVDDVFSESVVPRAAWNLKSASGPDDIAYVIFTSGTTGKPKGSLITHRNVARLFASTEHWFHFNEQDVFTLFHSCAFDFSVWEIWGALFYGGRVVVVPFLMSRCPEDFYGLLATEKVTVLNQTPSAFRQLIQTEVTLGQKELALRYVVFGGEALEMHSLRAWFQRHGDQKPRLINMYGITETTVHVTYRPLSKDDLDSGSVIGVPIPDLQIYILDSERQPVPIGVPGEMYVGGAGLAQGYLNRPELTAERFVPDNLTGTPNARLYKTGDLARFLPGRDIEYLGRIDHQVKIRGFRIELGEIESALCQDPAVREAVVISRDDEQGSKRLAAYLVPSGSSVDIAALREQLKKKLPEYMVPAAFVLLEKLPLTASGKLDVKKLPAPVVRPELAASYVAPRTPNEQKLAEIWSKVLRVTNVGVNDNFFELGGDSILSIQIISAARQKGLKLSLKVLFANQTIAELAATVRSEPEAGGNAEDLAGDVPLSPIQHWFFEQRLEQPNHYNQSFFFKTTERLEKSLLTGAMREVCRHHDGLRLRFERKDSRWRQFYSNSDESATPVWVDLSRINDEGRKKQFDLTAAAIQSSLNFESGPAWQIAYFDLGPGLEGRLLIAAHHLVMDGVSWRPLLEDLETAYQQLKANRTVQLPPKTSSFKVWGERLSNSATSKRFESELQYWKDSADSEGLNKSMASLLPVSTSPRNIEGGARTLVLSLSTDETHALLQRVPSAYGTQITDVLLTALARAWTNWTGQNFIYTNLEGHGREDLFENVDLSRTIGWFTSIFPVRLVLPSDRVSWSPGEALKSVKEQLRRIPLRGIGYGILRYLGQNSELRAQIDPPIVFNYLGQFDQVVAGSKLFRFAKEPTGPWHSAAQRRRHAIEANCCVIDEKLQLQLTFCEVLQSAAELQKFANEFVIALQELISHCVSAKGAARTPSDFPLANVSQTELDGFLERNNGVEDIYRLSPMQTLFYSANPSAVSNAFDQWYGTLSGDLKISEFQMAWEETFRRHPVLRSTIHGEGLSQPLQIVHRDIQVPWKVEDWRSIEPNEQLLRWNTFLEQDRSTPLNLDNAPVMRFFIARIADDRWKFLWTVPSILLDGWSWPIVFQDASSLYQSFSKNQSPQLETARPYRNYIEWLGKQDTSESKVFWRKTLNGFLEPTPLSSNSAAVKAGHQRRAEAKILISRETTGALQAAARELRITLSSLLQGAWALLISRASHRADVVFGAAFSGRPETGIEAEKIVGPFVNNLPVRVRIENDSSLDGFFRGIHSHAIELTHHQFMPLIDIQECSQVPWRHRLFESVVVFQNYSVNESAYQFGNALRIEDFVAPIHSNYQVMLLAEPSETLRLTLIYDPQRMEVSTMEQWGRDLAILLEQIPNSLRRKISDLQALLFAPTISAPESKRKFRADSTDYAAPNSEMERRISSVWQEMFGLERVSVEENLFDLGGHSLLIVQLQSRLVKALKQDFPIVALFEYPTIRLLAAQLDSTEKDTLEIGKQARERALRQKQALAGLQGRLRKTGK